MCYYSNRYDRGNINFDHNRFERRIKMEGKEKKEEEKVEKVKKTKKKPNIILYTALMILCFFVLTELVIWGYASGFVLESILHYSQGYLIVSEAVLSALILVVVLIFGNSYIFTQKREKLSKGLLYGLFFIICYFLFLACSVL